MADTFYIKKGSTLPQLIDRFTQGGEPIELDGTGIVRIKHQYGGSLFSRAYELFPDQDTDANKGKILVDWESSDIDDREFGTHYIEYVHTYADGHTAIFPTDGEVLYDRMEVLKPLS